MNGKLDIPVSAEALSHWADTLDESAREFYEERAGILQFEASLSRFDAEREAYHQTLQWMQERNASANQP